MCCGALILDLSTGPVKENRKERMVRIVVVVILIVIVIVIVAFVGVVLLLKGDMTLRKGIELHEKNKYGVERRQSK